MASSPRRSALVPTRRMGASATWCLSSGIHLMAALRKDTLLSTASASRKMSVWNQPRRRRLVVDKVSLEYKQQQQKENFSYARVRKEPQPLVLFLAGLEHVPKLGIIPKKYKKNGNFTVSHKVTLYSASLMRNICVWLSNLRNGNESVDWRATLCGPLFVCWFVCFSFVDETAHRMETVNGFAWPTNEVKVGESKSRGQRKTNQRGVQVSRKGILLAFFLTTQGRHRTEPFIIAPKKIEFKQIRAKIINLNHEQVYQFESMMHQNLTLMKIQ